MPFRALCALVLAGASFVPSGPVLAQAAELSPPGQVLRNWLVRINEAARLRNFQGTFVVSGGGSISSARIAHFCESGSQFERIESLDGQARQVYRHNEVVHTLWPGKRIALVEQREMLMSFPSVARGGDDQIDEYYEVSKLESDRVAGYEAKVLSIRPKDSYRFGLRLWAEQATGLLLRADVLGERNEVIETAAFSDLVIGVKPQLDLVLLPMKKLDGYRIVRPVLTPTTLEAEGWTLKQGVPGFRQVSCVKRPMDTGPRSEGRVAPEVVQAIFSDGLTHVSLFVEPFDSRRHGRAMVASVGATQTLTRRHGDWWLTVIGDVPAISLRMFAEGLERRP